MILSFYQEFRSTCNFTSTLLLHSPQLRGNLARHIFIFIETTNQSFFKTYSTFDKLFIVSLTKWFNETTYLRMDQQWAAAISWSRGSTACLNAIATTRTTRATLTGPVVGARAKCILILWATFDPIWLTAVHSPTVAMRRVWPFLTWSMRNSIWQY